MGQLTAGDTITLSIDGKPLTVKIEDASKSEHFSARVESSGHEHYQPERIYEFPRTLL